MELSFDSVLDEVLQKPLTTLSCGAAAYTWEHGKVCSPSSPTSASSCAAAGWSPAAAPSSPMSLCAGATAPASSQSPLLLSFCSDSPPPSPGAAPPPRSPAPGSGLTCATCGKRFAWRHKLKIHQRRHTDERPLECRHEHCSFRAKWFSSLANHYRRAHNC